MGKTINLKSLNKRVQGVKKAVIKMKGRRGTTAAQRRILNLFICHLDCVQQSILVSCSPRQPKYWL